MAQEEFVTNCQDCPFMNSDKEDGFSCNHPIEHLDLYLEDTMKIPENCPLKEGPITIQLTEF